MRNREPRSLGLTLAPGLIVVALAPLLAPCAVVRAAREHPTETWVTPAIRAPRLNRHVFHSAAIQRDVSCHVYTPKAYDAQLNQQFPVVYWLHGRGGGTAGMVARLAEHFDRAVRSGIIPPVLVVIPNGLAESMWCDSKDGQVPMETIVVEELVPFIDRTFRTIVRREGRMIEGFSMGGYGAARLGLKYQGMFGSVSILGAGPMQREFSASVGPPRMARARLRVLHRVYGNDQDYFKALSPWVLAEEHAEPLRGKLNVRLAVGTRDSMLNANRNFAEHLASLQIPHKLHVVPDVGHHPIALFSALGDTNWAFYRRAFSDMRVRRSAAEPSVRVLVLGKSKLVDPPRQQKRAADAVRKVAEAARNLGPRVVVDALAEEVMTKERVLAGESEERVTGSVFLDHLARLAEAAGPADTVIIYTHTHGVRKGVARPNSPGGLVLDPPFRRFGHRGLLAWDEYADYLLPIPAKHVVVMTMACFSGGLIDTLESAPMKARWEHRREEGRSLVVLTSQDNRTMSPPIVLDRELINPFTYAVAEALAGAADGFCLAAGEPSAARPAEGQITIGELIDYTLYTTQHTPSESLQRPNIARPRVTGSFDRDVVLCRFAAESADGEDLKFATATRLSPGRHTVNITVEGWARSYLVHVPPHTDSAASLPVVIMFHGGGGSAEDARRATGWDRKADREGFLAVFPEGTPPDSSRPGRFVGNPQTWNDGSRRDFAAVRRKAPDIAFVDAIMNDLKARCPVDRRRIYVTGFSNGVSMAFRVARERPDLVAAAAPVAGSDWLTDTELARPVPLLYMTGSVDPLNPLEGGPVSIGSKRYRPKPPVEAMIRRWVKLHGCRTMPRTVCDQKGAKGLAYSRPDVADMVVCYTLDGHGHHWPGGKSLLPRWIAGPNSARLNATDMIWAFFEQHARPIDELEK